jgi:hypothetical protein
VSAPLLVATTTTVSLIVVFSLSFPAAKDVINESIRHAKVKETKRFKRLQEVTAASATGAGVDAEGAKKKQEARPSSAASGSQPAATELQRDKNVSSEKRENHASKWMSRRTNTLAKVMKMLNFVL